MRVFNPMMFNVAFKIYVVGSAGGQVRQVDAEGGIYHAVGTDLYFIYDPNTGKFFYFNWGSQTPGETELTEEDVKKYTMEPVNIDV